MMCPLYSEPSIRSILIYKKSNLKNIQQLTWKGGNHMKRRKIKLKYVNLLGIILVDNLKLYVTLPSELK